MVMNGNTETNSNSSYLTKEMDLMWYRSIEEHGEVEIE